MGKEVVLWTQVVLLMVVLHAWMSNKIKDIFVINAYKRIIKLTFNAKNAHCHAKIVE